MKKKRTAWKNPAGKDRIQYLEEESAQIEAMSEMERIKKIARLREELRKLRTIPRDDWHAGFEAVLRIEMHPYGDKVTIETEKALGEEPPRADYLILVKDKDISLEKEIFKHFRSINIIEYKNPHDSLNIRVLYKICGYAHLLIGTAEHEGDIPPDQVTVSIFRSVKNRRLFNSMEKAGMLKRNPVKGIYHIEKMTSLPFQIVITGELEGEEYAAYRALTDKAREEDVLHVLTDDKKETDVAMQTHYDVLIDLIAKKNPGLMGTIWEENAMSSSVLYEQLKDKVEARYKEQMESKFKEQADQLEKQIQEAQEKLMASQEQAHAAQEQAQAAQEQAQEERTLLTESIKIMMNSLNMTVEEVMSKMGIPPEKQTIYRDLIKNG